MLMPPPHIGHAYEKVIADALARWHRLLGKKVWYLTGTDENAQKNAQAAKVAGIPTKEFVDKNSKIFKKLVKELNLSNDDFIRTTETRHVKFAKAIFKKIHKKGDIYKGKYEGLYCVGCEGFKTEKDLVDGKCPEHNTAPELISEEAYFFRLSKYKNKIIDLIKNKKLITPKEKANEILSRLEEEDLRDLCVSRTNLKWGIDSPIDKKFKIYVWIDALSNYISALEKKEKDFWPADVHVIGKGINWFHTVIWPAILLSAGYNPPKKVWVHGYLTVDGKKMSKSLGNVINPLDLLKKYSSDSLRYTLLRIPSSDDGDFSEKVLIERNNSELANKLGNLVSRTTALAEKYGIEKCDVDVEVKNIYESVKRLMERYELDKALTEIFAFIDTLNNLVQSKKIWETGNKKDLYELLVGIKTITILLWPFIPETCEKIAKHLGFKLDYKEISKPYKIRKIKKVPILFKKVELKQAEIIGVKKMSEINFNDVRNTHKSRISEHLKNQDGLIDFSRWQKLDLKVGKILKVEDIPKADKLYKLTADIGEKKSRTLVAGVKKHYKKSELKNKKFIFLTNLEAKKIKGIESYGMILAAVTKNKIVLIKPDKDIEIGSKVS